MASTVNNKINNNRNNVPTSTPSTNELEKQVQIYIGEGYELKNITPTSAEVICFYKWGVWDWLLLLLCPFGIIITLIFSATKKPQSCYFNIFNGKLTITGCTLKKRKEGNPNKKPFAIIGSIIGIILLICIFLALIGALVFMNTVNSSQHSSTYYDTINNNESYQDTYNDNLETSGVNDNSLGEYEPHIISNNEYILINSNTQRLTTEDILYLSPEQLRLARNEIYARHGYVFESQDLNDYFNNQEWYIPKYNNDSITLNEIEIANVEFIRQYEDN